jgi:hypothetical protein
MANIRASYVISQALLATTASVAINIAAAGGVTATGHPTPVIRVSAFVVATSALENQTVIMSDFRAFNIDQVSIDIATATDDVAISFDTSFSDSVTMDDTVNRMFYGNIDFDPTDPDADPDPINIADADAKDVGKTLTDTAEATDADAKTTGKVLSDSTSGVVDAINSKDVGKSLTDTAAAADAVNAFDTSKVVADSASITDAAAKELTRPDVADSIAATDTSYREPGLGKTDSITSTDVLNAFDIGKNPSDSITASDAVNKFDVTTVLADSVEITDFIAKTPGYNFDYDIVDADADPDPVTATDVMAKDFTRPNITDTASVTDALANNPGLVKTETVTATDSDAKSFDTARTDSVSATDAAAITFSDVQTDTVSATDAISSFAIQDVQADAVTGTDAVNIFAFTKVLTDTASITDALVTELILGQTTAFYPDYVSMGDGNGFVQHRFYARRPDYTAVLGEADSLLNSSYIWNQSTESFAYENYTGLIGGPGLLMVAPLIGGEFITYADTSGSGIVVNFYYTDAPDRSVGGYKLNETPIL